MGLGAVAPMGYPGAVIATRSRPRRRYPRRRRDVRRTRRLVAVGLGVAALCAAGVSALRSGGDASTSDAIARAPAPQLAPDGPPQLEELATAPGGLVLDVPVRQARITAIVYHGVGSANVIPLEPIGRQKNANFLERLGSDLTGTSEGDGPSYYVDEGGEGVDTGSVDVGAPADTSVYAPVDGTVVSIRPYVIDGVAWGSVLQIQPTSAPATIVTLTNVDLAPGVDVGTPVTHARTRIGRVKDLSKALDQTLSRFTSDSGNHVHIEVSPAPAASPLL
jgi:hypothetical protein